jgi:hypothetical protein
MSQVAKVEILGSGAQQESSPDSVATPSYWVVKAASRNGMQTPFPSQHGFSPSFCTKRMGRSCQWLEPLCLHSVAVMQLALKREIALKCPKMSQVDKVVVFARRVQQKISPDLVLTAPLQLHFIVHGRTI